MNEPNGPPRPPPPPPAFPKNPGPPQAPEKAEEPEGKPGPMPVAETEDDRRPTPVRMGMETEEEPEAPPVGPEFVRTFRDPDSGVVWCAEVTGWGMSGVLPLRTVPLLEVVFRPEGSTEPPVKRIVHQGEGLRDFTEEDMAALFSRAEPYREPSADPTPDSSPSRKKRKRQSRD